MALIEKITAVADAIRAKTGNSAAMTLDGMAEAVEGIQTGGSGDGYDVVDAIIDGSITEISSNVESIAEYAFHRHTMLTDVEFPRATLVRGYAFTRCTNLKTVYLPSVINIGTYAFQNCESLTEVYFPSATTVEASAFTNCSQLKTANLPSLESIASSAFYGSNRLTTAEFPCATSIADKAFQNCSSLKTTDFRAVTSVGSNAFYQCTNLPVVDFPLVTDIAAFAFYSCRTLTSVILRSETMCTLQNTSAFNDCVHFLGTKSSVYNPEGLKDGYIYVPTALIEDYKVSTNWSKFATQFRALEDYTVDGTITGALDPNKI